jgi:hypothetical protein
MQFLEVQPSVENCWRALILFGLNVASYKFALGKALLELRGAPAWTPSSNIGGGPGAMDFGEGFADFDFGGPGGE